MEIRQTLTYARWFAGLTDRRARARVLVRIRRLGLGNPGDLRSLGEGVHELRIHYGPGYRVYLVRRGAAGPELVRWLMTRTRTKAWDAADYLARPEDIAAYLEAALEEGDPRLVAAALGDVARARGMTRLAGEAGLGRESLYKALSRNGNPELATVLRILGALGLRLRVTAKGGAQARPGLRRAHALSRTRTRR